MNSSPLIQKIESLRQELARADPHILAMRIGAAFEQGEFRLLFLNQPIVMPFPLLAAQDAAARQPLPPDRQALLLYHLKTSDGSPAAGRWVSFGELPGGAFYAPAYQGYSGDVLVRHFGRSPQAFPRAAQILGGQPIPLGDAAFAFQSLPRVPLAVILWQGDDDFPASMRVLFDASATRHLPVDVCAIVGSMLARALIKASDQ